MRDRAIVALARFLTRAFFRSVEVEGRPPPEGPVVLAASHLYGFVDPVVLVARLGRFPRFLAKATLWDVPGAGVLLRLARAIPVHRPEDGVVEGANDGTFAAAVEALRAGGLVAIFPEGTTHDEPTLRPLRTGAARIALDAAAAGVTRVSVVPVGVTYEDKVDVRGRALVSYGPPIPVVAPAPGADARAAVRDLTDRLQRALQDLTPHFATTEEALALQAAATISLTVDGDPPLLADVSARARRLARLEDGRRDALVDLVARYRMLLGFVDLDDADVARRDVLAVLARRLVVLGVLGVLLAPFAVAGLFANLVPAALVLVAGLVVRAPVSKGTVRLLVALVAFPTMWGVWAWHDASAGALGDLARRVTYPVALAVGPEPTD
ncbi:MAG TPA: 1-acyl-sn-glycerol-3-phosphate acyltransferase, partial [Iamia sp.]|nr:1-acyl-sn-glycerol-3-phosphate acyltransferase [Iamia sp.]